jgi:F-type H+-transporting ATPase subunit epsilon
VVHLQLITLNGIAFDDEVYEVLLPTMDGQVGVMPGHMPLVTVAKPGAISIRRSEHDIDEAMEHFAMSGGVIEVIDDRLRVLVDEADHESAINETEAQEAHARALKMKAEASDQVDLERAQSLIDRTAVRLHVAGLRHRKRH